MPKEVQLSFLEEIDKQPEMLANLALYEEWRQEAKFQEQVRLRQQELGWIYRTNEYNKWREVIQEKQRQKRYLKSELEYRVFILGLENDEKREELRVAYNQLLAKIGIGRLNIEEKDEKRKN